MSCKPSEDVSLSLQMTPAGSGVGEVEAALTSGAEWLGGSRHDGGACAFASLDRSNVPASNVDRGKCTISEAGD